jgi:hypothetical protein
MNTNQTVDIARLQNILSEDDIKQLEDILFYRDDDGSYKLFEQYTIANNNKHYTVYKYNNVVSHQFSTLKHALCYCINSKRNKIHAMQQIMELDRKLSALDIDIQIQRRLINKNVDTELHEIKLNESTLLRTNIAKQMQRYVEESDRWQTNRFGQRLNLRDK